jgi:hypothetical protein
MIRGYAACRLLYRAARPQEGSSPADRRAVRLALAAAITTGLRITTASAASASAGAATTIPPMSAADAVSVGASGGSSGVAGVGATAVGAKGVLHLLIGGKFLSGLLAGTVLGTAVTTSAIVVQPNTAEVPSAIRPLQHKPARRVALLPTFEGPSATTTQSRPKGSEASRNTVSSETATQAQAAVVNIAVRTGEVSPSRIIAEPGGRLTSNGKRSTYLSGLAQETQALVLVELALAKKDPSTALELIERQEQQFPAGQLAEERAAAQVLALCAAGQAARADLARSRFQLVYPNSPLARRVAVGCDR